MSGSFRFVYPFLTVALMCVSCALDAFADGKMFIWRNEKVDVFQPSQKAVIAWDGATETLTIQTKYEGPAEEMVWLVPVPAEPEVEKGNPGVFDEMSQRTQEPYILYTEFEGGDAGGSGGAAALEWRRRIGAYDVALLKPVGGQTVLEWLEINEFGVEPEAKPILNSYIDRGWWVVASRIHKDALAPSVQERLAKGTIEPLKFTFTTRQCVYPLHLTSLAAGPVEVLLWIKGSNHFEPVTLSDGPWQIDFHGGPPRARLTARLTWRSRDWARIYHDPAKPDSPAECITKLRRTFHPSEMTYDIYFGPVDYAKYFDTQDPVKVGTVATQFGLWRDASGAEPLVTFLSTGTLTDEPHVRSAVWALGEISVGGVQSSEIDEVLLRCV
jgi:hypothetical protein